jgi:aminobenzoyl-glutamate utilization protein B
VKILVAFLLCVSLQVLPPALAVAPPEMKQEAAGNIDAHAKLVQVMVDTVFSYGEPGFQEFRTGEYLTGILEKSGFKITRGVAGIPTAWTATWGEGGPLIAMGSDEGCRKCRVSRTSSRWWKVRRATARAITRVCPS